MVSLIGRTESMVEIGARGRGVEGGFFDLLLKKIVS